MGKNLKINNIMFISGPLAFTFYVLHDVLGSLNYPGYNAMTQAVSDLTAANAPSIWIAQPLSIGYGLFSIICTIQACFYLYSKLNKVQWTGLLIFALMNIISFFGYTLFPLSEAGTPAGFQNTMHIVVTILVVVSSIVSLLLVSFGSYKKMGDKALGMVSLLAFILMLVGAIGTNVAPASIFGIVERFSIYAAVGFTCFIGIRCMASKWVV